MKVFVASDHAGFELKEKVKGYLLGKGFDVEDLGALQFDKQDDYPDFIAIAAKKVSENPGSFGIIFGKSGAGEAIVANKIKGIRAIIGFSEENVRLARLHNDANVLSLGSAFITPDQANGLIELFIATEFSNEERHKRRIEKIKKIEDSE